MRPRQLVCAVVLSAVGLSNLTVEEKSTGAQSLAIKGAFDVASESILPAHGDSWTAAWCQNDVQYIMSDDSKNIDGACVNPVDGKGYNVVFGELTSPDAISPLAGQSLSCMAEYGLENETSTSTSSSNSCSATWKGIGTVCMGDTLLMGISRHVYAWNLFGNSDDRCYADRQKAFDGSVITSSDGGRSWLDQPELDAHSARVAFPGSFFGTPSFIQYGRGMTEWLADGAQQYLYAISNDGFWNNGNALFLARTQRDSGRGRDDWEYLVRSSPPAWRHRGSILTSNSSFEDLTEDRAVRDWRLYGGAHVVTSTREQGNQAHSGGRSVAMYETGDGVYRTVTGLTSGTPLLSDRVRACRS